MFTLLFSVFPKVEPERTSSSPFTTPLPLAQKSTCALRTHLPPPTTHNPTDDLILKSLPTLPTPPPVQFPSWSGRCESRVGSGCGWRIYCGPYIKHKKWLRGTCLGYVNVHTWGGGGGGGRV